MRFAVNGKLVPLPTSHVDRPHWNDTPTLYPTWSMNGMTCLAVFDDRKCRYAEAALKDGYRTLELSSSGALTVDKWEKEMIKEKQASALKQQEEAKKRAGSKEEKETITRLKGNLLVCGLRMCE